MKDSMRRDKSSCLTCRPGCSGSPLSPFLLHSFLTKRSSSRQSFEERILFQILSTERLTLNPEKLGRCVNMKKHSAATWKPFSNYVRLNAAQRCLKLKRYGFLWTGSSDALVQGRLQTGTHAAAQLWLDTASMMSTNRLTCGPVRPQPGVRRVSVHLRSREVVSGCCRRRRRELRSLTGFLKRC